MTVFVMIFNYTSFMLTVRQIGRIMDMNNIDADRSVIDMRS